MPSAPPPPRKPFGPTAAFHFEVGTDSPILTALDKAGSGPLHQPLADIKGALSAAVSALMDARATAQPRADFAAEILSFKKALDAFVPEIPDALSAAGAAIVDRWNESAVVAIESGQRDMRGVDPMRPVSIAFPDTTALWILRDGLQRLSDAVHELAVEERIGMRGSPPADRSRADHQFVAALKVIFEQSTGKKASAGTNHKGSTQRERVGSDFGHFVLAVEDEAVRQERERLLGLRIKKAGGGHLPPITPDDAERFADQLRLEGPHHLIQTACPTPKQRTKPPKYGD